MFKESYSFHALQAESEISEHQQTAGNLRKKMNRVDQENERYRGFFEELQSTQSSTHFTGYFTIRSAETELLSEVQAMRVGILE